MHVFEDAKVSFISTYNIMLKKAAGVSPAAFESTYTKINFRLKPNALSRNFNGHFYLRILLLKSIKCPADAVTNLF